MRQACDAPACAAFIMEASAFDPILLLSFSVRSDPRRIQRVFKHPEVRELCQRGCSSTGGVLQVTRSPFKVAKKRLGR